MLFLSLHFVVRPFILNFAGQTMYSLLDSVNFLPSFIVPFVKKTVVTEDIIYYILSLFYLIIKIGVYTISINADNNSIRGDFVYYISEFCSNAFSIFSSSLGFFLRVVLLLFTIIGNIYFINVCGYFFIFTIKFDPNGNLYVPRIAFEESFKLARGFVLLLMFTNTIIAMILYLLYFFTPILPKYKDINITLLIKTIFFDSIFVYYIYTAYSLQKYRNKLKFKNDEEILKKEHSRRLVSAGRAQL
jgi:hypothetical protein